MVQMFDVNALMEDEDLDLPLLRMIVGQSPETFLHIRYPSFGFQPYTFMV